MNKFKIITVEGLEKEVDGIFYLYNSKYFFAYTEKEVDDKGYVVFNLVQVGKEIKNTPDGPIDTGYMIGMEIPDTDEWKNVQMSITKIVEDKKNNSQSEEIQYLPQNMLSTLKIMSSKTFRLAKNVVEQVFGITVLNEMNNQDEKAIGQVDQATIPPKLDDNMEVESPLDVYNDDIDVVNNIDQNNIDENFDVAPQNEVIIDYRARFFEEQAKNEQLEEQIKALTEKLDSIRTLIG